MLDVPPVIAHRGSSGRAPENTLEAMRLAIAEDGAGGLELDLQRTADGEVVVLHDETVDRTTDGRGRADAYPLDALRELDAGCRHPGFSGRGIRIPTLREVLEEFEGVWLSLDLKRGDPVTETGTARLLREFGRGRDVVLGAEDPASARRLAATAPEFARFLDRSSARAFYLRHRLRFLRGANYEGASLQIPTRHRGRDLTGARLIDDAHRQGLVVIYWTINDPEEARALFAKGADGVITDWPDRLRGLGPDSRMR